MKSAYLVEPKHIEIRQEEIPVPNEREILVKIAYCGICTLEQRLFTGERTIWYPLVPGHEACGEVVAVGPQVIGNVSVKDHVVLDLVNRCHACSACRSGNSNLCENRFKKGQRVLGAFTEYLVVRDDQIQVIPPDFPLEQAAFTEPLSCCIRSLRKVHLGLGDTVLISGVGTMGMLHVKTALAIGAKVIATDIVQKRLRDAKRIGADAVVDASDVNFAQKIRNLTGGRGVDCSIITTTSQAACKAAAQVLSPGGRLNIYTSYDDEPTLPIDMNTLHRNEYQITGSEGRDEQDFYTSVKALVNRKIVVDDLISRIYPLSEISEAMEAALGGDLYRVLVKME